jgi:hypothetical protein
VAQLTTFLTAHAGAIFWIGIVVELGGGIWFLFDSYRCDVDLARWTLLFPPLGIYLAFRYPEECLKSFLVCIVGIVLITVGEKYAPSDSLSLNAVQSAIESQMGQ